MKKKYIVAILSCAILLAGCGNRNANTSSGEEALTEETASGEWEEDGLQSEPDESMQTEGMSDYVKQLKAKYAGSEKNQYADPMYNLPNDYEFVFPMSEDYTREVYDDLQVFSDAELTQRVDIVIEQDYDGQRAVLKPGIVFNYNVEQSSSDMDGTWGSISKFYLVQNYDLAANKAYDKPQITVFTIARDLQSPTLSQSVAENGYYKLSWDAVEGADSYEVYEFDKNVEYAQLRLKTEKLSCTYDELKPWFLTYEEWESGDWEQQADPTDGEEDANWFINQSLEVDNSFFVVARSNSGKYSGMSNLCEVEKIAGSIPHIQVFGVETSYEGTSALALPAYTEVEMLDESVAKLLLDYKNATVTELGDQFCRIDVNIKNMPMQIMPLTFQGMDYEAFMKDMEKVYDRQNKLATKSVTQETDINIPYVPTDGKKPDQNSHSGEETSNEREQKDDTASDRSAAQTSNVPGLEDTIYANSALSAWIAYNMLHHEEQIPLDNFTEASDTEYLLGAVMEAYQQNPLIGVMDSASYDYDTNSLLIGYLLDKEETVEKQTASIQKAQEIADDIIEAGMSDFEKEEAINAYLCRNASYNEEILNYIDEDGMISTQALRESVDSFLPYGILVDNFGVCESYAEAFLLIAQKAGLDAVIETGRLDGVNHEWNRVKIDGSWCILDVTNNDSDYLPNSFFNLSDQTAKGLLIPDGTSIMQQWYMDYAADDNDKEYYYTKGQYVLDKDEAVSMFEGLLSKEDQGAVRIEEELGASDVEDIVRQVGRAAGLKQGVYYYDRGVLSIITE